MSKPLADLLWDRIEPFFTRRDVLRIRPVGFGNEGTWKPTRLNECFKFSKYSPGGHFSPHLDGPWVPREDESSIYTVIIYLNDDFTGGQTTFLQDNHQQHQVQPKQGTALLFNHDILHAAEPIEEGVKYIVRTEVMFRRVDTAYIPLRQRKNYAQDQNYLQTLRLYRQSMRKEAEGDRQGFIDSYLEALRLQCQQQRSVGRDAEELSFEGQLLPFEIYVHIFSFLDEKEVTRLLTVCKDWYDMARDGSLWLSFYRRR
ncbi:Fe2OG dioxygenase domain-containing protein [Balamuthia mandrillaris]